MDNIVLDRTVAQLTRAIDIVNGDIGTDSTSVGMNASAEGDESVAVGQGAYVEGDNAVAVGTFSGGEADDIVAIGHEALATADGAIQIGEGENNTANTVKFKNITILDPNGKIPFSALQSGEVVGLSVNASNHLIVTYANGTTEDLGEISGGASIYEINASYINNEIYFQQTDIDYIYDKYPLLIKVKIQVAENNMEQVFVCCGRTTISGENGNVAYLSYTDFDGTLTTAVIPQSASDSVDFSELLPIHCDSTPTSDSTNPVTSGGVYTAIQTAIGDINTALTALISGGGVQ